ncbi:MAG: hypothetical protein MJE68_26440 [Proteobacteria bacterium]|nr:hypothetical protein [Pseudomonadota bacterium]
MQSQDKRKPLGEPSDRNQAPPHPQPPPKPQTAPEPRPGPKPTPGPPSKPTGAQGLNTKPPPGAKTLPKGAERVDVNRLVEWQKTHPGTSVHIGGLDLELLAGATVNAEGEPTPLLSRGSGQSRHPPTVKVAKRSHSAGDANAADLMEPPLKALRPAKDFENLQGRIIGDATFDTADAGLITVTGGRGMSKYSGPPRGGGAQ